MLAYQFEEPIQEDRLIRMNQLTGFGKRHESGLVDFPRSASRRSSRGSLAREAVDALFAFAVFDVAERNELRGDDAGFFLGFASGCYFQISFILVRLALRDAIRFASIVIT